MLTARGLTDRLRNLSSARLWQSPVETASRNLEELPMKIRPLGDRVVVEVSPYDLSKGCITLKKQ